VTVGLVSLLILGSFVLSLVLGLPVAFGLLGVSVLFALVFLGPAGMYLALTSTFQIFTNDLLLAIPLFIVMAAILQFSGIAAALYDVMYKWFGPLRGGLAMGTVAISTLIASMTGLAGTAVVVMGVIALPEMLRRGYDKDLAVGCIPPGGALGPLIPPSSIMIITAVYTEVSVGKLFIGGIVPGLLLACLYCIYIAVRCNLKPNLGPPLAPEERASWREKIISLRGVVLPVLLVILVLGGIYSGATTPTEAGAVGGVGAIICAAIYRRLTWKNMKQALFFSMKINGMVLWVLGGASSLGSIMNATGVSNLIGDTLNGLAISPILLVVVIQLIIFILGMFMNVGPIQVILLPICMPIIISLGLDPLWFAILCSMNFCLSYITPPFGIDLFYMQGVVPKDITMMDIYRSVLPFVGMQVIALALGILFPSLLLWLPATMK
jgi:tripartite ATP-independent transporter DctM subunit